MDQRQHYVPQFYQRGWTENNEGLIWVYRKNENPKRQSIGKRVGMEINFYDDGAVPRTMDGAAMMKKRKDNLFNRRQSF